MRRIVPKGYTAGTTYPVGDMPTSAETGGAPFKERMLLHSCGIDNARFRVIPTGEKRVPRRGEWYLSGAEVTGFRAPNDLLSEFMIARLVRVERVVTETYRIIELTGAKS